MTRYRDKNGDVWEDRPEGWMELVQSSTPSNVGTERESWAVGMSYGPLVETNPHTDAATSRVIRAELALVLQELADDAYSDYRFRDDVDADISYRVHALLESKAQALRDETGEPS